MEVSETEYGEVRPLVLWRRQVESDFALRFILCVLGVRINFTGQFQIRVDVPLLPDNEQS